MRGLVACAIVDFMLTEFQQQFRSAVMERARSFSLEYWREQDRNGTYPTEFVAAFAKDGWLGTVIPAEYGGSGLGMVEAALLMHAISASGAGASGASPIHFSVFPPAPIVKFGSEEMKRRYLPRIASGDLQVAFGVTEPTAGTDTSRIQTRATRRPGGGWVVDGQKIWSSNAQKAEKYLLLARTSPRDDARPLWGMTLFFADMDRSACEVRPIEKLGRAALDSNEVFIRGLVVEDADVVGDVGRGFAHLIESLNPERIVIAMEAAGLGRAALEIASRYAKERVVFDRPIGMNQAIAHPLARAWAALEAGELLALKAAWLYDHGIPCGSEANAAKFLAADAGFEACDAALQTLGGFGYAKEYHVERMWRESRLYRLAPISQEMVLNFIAQHELALPKSY
jgi:acyl-CoA dehydrogenase